MTETHPDQPSRELIETRAAFQQGFDSILHLARRELCLFDESGIDFRLNSIERHALLEQFLLAGKKQVLRIAVHDILHFSTQCPRMQGLLRRFSESIEIRQTGEQIRSVRDTLVIADGAHLLRRGDSRQPRGVVLLNDEPGTLPYAQRYEEIWECSAPAVFATTLGL